MKLLLLNVNREGWHSGNMIYDMMVIQKAFDTKIYGPGWPGYENTSLKKIIEQLYGDDKPDVIYSYFTPNEKVGDVYMSHYKIPESLRHFPTGFNDVKGPLKIFGLSDFWARTSKKYSEDLKDADFQYCFCCFAPPYSREKDFYSFFDENIRKKIKFIGFPRCVDKNCFKDYGLSKIHDVITVGAMWNFYPLRVMMHRFLNSNASSIGIKYKNYPHCGTNFYHSTFVRDEYARAINSSRMLASCGGKYHLAMNKIFESMGCMTAYVGEKPYGFEELGLKCDFNYIEVDHSNYIEKIKCYLSRLDLLDDIIKNANKLFLERHTVEKRVDDFIEKIKLII